MELPFSFPSTPIISESVPPGELWIVTPGEYVEVIAPDGQGRQVELKPPSGWVIKLHDAENL
jgi:hypothetical protein